MVNGLLLLFLRERERGRVRSEGAAREGAREEEGGVVITPPGVDVVAAGVVGLRESEAAEGDEADSRERAEDVFGVGAAEEAVSERVDADGDTPKGLERERTEEGGAAKPGDTRDRVGCPPGC